MKKRYTFLIYTFLVIAFFGCSNDDDITTIESFYNGALTSSTNQQLEGQWSIYQVKFENQVTDVPESTVECGRDFFSFQTDGSFKEYLFDNSQCTPQKGELSWTLSDGIITFTSGFETNQWVITELSSKRFVFKILLDLDNDGEPEIYQAICKRYQPPVEIYTGNFSRANTSENNNLEKILLKWDAYKGYNNFEKYEIYRFSEGCSNINNLELISTITDPDIISFIDETPPALEEICYVFKIYTDSGLLESLATNVNTGFMEISSVNLEAPILNNTTINLTWDKYQGYYFSHYKIVVRNYSSGSGGGYQEEEFALIDNIETTSFSSEQPYFSNPVFVIYVYNIFGDKNYYAIESENQQSTTFERDGILPINQINFLASSPNETILYYSDYSDLYRYNYKTNHVENSIVLNSSSIIFIKVIESSFGTEVMVNKGGEIMVYDSDLNFKYNLNLKVDIFFTPDHLIINEDGYWLATDREKLYSFTRTENQLDLINTNNLYNKRFSASDINIIDLGKSKILVGNKIESQGLVVEINSDGELSISATEVNFNVISEWDNSLYSRDKKYILNSENNTVYATETNNLLNTLNQGFFLKNISNDGSFILGTNNNPNSSTDYYHEKKLKTFSYPLFAEKNYETKGYPHFIFQNHLGEIISISKGLIGSLNVSAQEKDIFIEIIE
ncbi:hypothetical protein [uncultured Polaribacter sp.]|uniref:hypothetical protein n=1 Tax=uncultured Polaribacter sp. TaxID=174711 RepID=UPI00260844F7|nr:hypothetical protein [uncultured Polaribacter sp.]